MKKILIYILFFNIFFLHNTVLRSAEILKMDEKNYRKYVTNDERFKRILSWKAPYGDKNWITQDGDLSTGYSCFKFVRAYTFDVNQVSFEFQYKPPSTYSQDANCVNEIYEISTEPNNSLLYFKGINNGSANGKLPYSTGKYFFIVTDQTVKNFCIKWASTKGVNKTCFNTSLPIQKFTQIFQTRLDAIKMREESKGNLVVLSQPKEIETSVTDTSGPKIDVPGKLIAKNDQIILNGKITDDNQVASVKIDNTPIVLDKKGKFEIDLFVPLDGTKVIIEAIDKFANKTTRTIVISREQLSEKKEIVKLPSLNPTKINAKENPNALAIIIGITNYKNIPISVYADKDAKLFSDFAYRSLGVSRDKIKLLINDTANYIEIKKLLKRWLKNEIVKGKTDVYLFFAGHGLVSDNQKDLYLIPFDGEPSLLDDTSIKRSELFSLISENDPSSITAFLDTCYSGLTRQNKMLIADARPLKIVSDKSTIPSNINLLTASSNNQIASGLEEAEHGMFSHYLMDGLSGKADLNKNKKITAEELHSYLREKVKKQALKLGRDQTPQFKGDKNKVLVRLN